MRKLKLIMATLALILGWSNASAYQTPEDEGTYYLYNEETGLFMSRGATWGTRAAADNYGAPITLTLADGKYTLTAADRNVNGYGGQWWMYSDEGTAANRPMEIIAVSDGNYKLRVSAWGTADQYVYINAAGEGGFTNLLAGNSGDQVGLAEGMYLWKFLSQEERDAVIANKVTANNIAIAGLIGYTVASTTELETLINDVNSFASTNLTSRISSASLESSYTGWTYNKEANRNKDLGCNANGIECYEGCGTLTQTVSGLNQGLYKVTINGFNRSGTNADCYIREHTNGLKAISYAYLDANGYKGQIKSWASDATSNSYPNSMGEAKTLFNDGKYLTTVYTYVDSDGKLDLTIGFPAFNDKGWYIFDNVTLTYYSDAVSDDDATAILATATSLESETMQASVLSALSSAKTTFDGARTIANYNALSAAISNAEASIANYAALLTAITNAENHVDYTPQSTASTTIYNNAISTAQGVYDAHTVADCSAAIAALTAGIQSSNVSDYNSFINDYEYSYSSLLNEDMREWTTSDWSMLEGAQHWNGKANQNYYEQTGAEWGQSSWNHSGTETVTLPAGKYIMSIIARAAAPVTSTMTVTVGDNSPITANLTHKGDNGKGITTAGVASFGDGPFANTDGRGWEYRFIAFEVDEDNTDVTINVSASASQEHMWVSLTNPLLKGDVHPNQIILNQISTLLSTLESYESLIHDDTYDTFSDDIADAEAATVETSTDDLTAIVTALQADIATANAMYERMTTITDNKGDLTSLINGNFTDNADGWTGGTRVADLARGWKDGSTKNPFYEAYGNEATMSYTLNNMPAGTYKVVAAWRSTNGGTMTPAIAGTNGTTVTGVGDAAANDGHTEINTNGVEMPYSTLGGFTTNASGHNWKWITATGTLAADGDLVFSFKTDGAKGWNAIDDVHLYCTNLDATNYTRTVGDGKGTINTSNSVVTADIVMENPNTILRTTGKVTTAAGEDMNNDQYNSSRITKLVLYDGYDFTNSGDNYGLDYGAILYRNIPANKWCTLVVPFYPTNLDVKKVPASLSGEGFLTFEDAPAKDMNDSPMLVKSTEGVTAITGLRNSTYGITKGSGAYGEDVPMTGVYVNGYVPTSTSDIYYYAIDSENNLLRKVTGSEVTIAPFRAYFTLDKASGARNIINLNFGDETTEISQIKDGQFENENIVYNLRGQRVSNPAKGLYIMNGKKIIIK